LVLSGADSIAAQASRAKKQKERVISLSIEINAPVDDVWKQWTTTDGLERFFAPQTKVELRPLGVFEVYFLPSAPVGQRGAEGNLILAIQPNEMLTFTWDAPPTWPEVRRHRTFVTLRFKRIGPAKTRLTFLQSGWGTTSDWDEVYRYFDRAGRTTVLPNLKYSLEVAPVDWTDFPNRLPKGLKPARRNPA
jgi:uncharacterized protein YndB with AHSA1/START domain